ncbi:cobaltochelatase subunit CobN [Pseudomonadota bacterium AL_CKDN230030165-1A_HGKHYDSX7]
MAAAAEGNAATPAGANAPVSTEARTAVPHAAGADDAGARQAARPRIAVISIELAQQPTTMRAAIARQAGAFDIDLYGLGGGQLPGIDEVDLAAYDLVLIEGVGPRLAQYRGRIDAAARRTRVLVLNGAQWVQGNVPEAAVPQANDYWRNGTADNYARLFDYLGARLLGLARPVQAPVLYAERAFYHPDHPQGFATLEQYLAWVTQRLPGAATRPRVGIVFYRSLALTQNAAVIDALIRETERQGGLPVPLWRSDSHDSLRLLRGANGKASVDTLILCASQIDYTDHRAGVAEARALDVAVLGCTTDYTRDAAQWRADLGGFAPDRSGQLALSEANGVIEPMMVGARRVAADGAVIHEPIAEQVQWRVERALAWTRLHRLPNADKRIVIAYHSEAADQADVGSDPDSYLDAQASLAALLPRLRAEGYDLGPDPLPDAKALAARMARDGGNVSAGLWDAASEGAAQDASATSEARASQARRARDELSRRIAAGGAVTIPRSRYLGWYHALPEALRRATETRWGPPPGRLMVHETAAGEPEIVIPVLRFGKVVLAPHPVWGYLQDTGALASTGALPPHHQYIAFYLWMAHGEQADAYVPLFTQLSLMPGKQQGPWRDDWIGRLMGTLPHIQPTPLQSNGGVGNKRRANAVTTGFMPAMAQGELPPDLVVLRDRLAEAGRSGAQADRQAVRALAAEHARALDLDVMQASWDDLDAALGRYLDEVAAAVIPLGGHVLGQAPDADSTARMVHAMLAGEFDAPPTLASVRAVLGGTAAGAAAAVSNVDLTEKDMAAAGRLRADSSAMTAEAAARTRDFAARIAAAGRETDALLAALSGGYVEPGPMADAVRNPDALPAGRNPYTFATRTLPTREAWQTGARLADELVADYQRNHDGATPRKVAFVLWSVESAQNHGAIEAQILRLLGARPVWNPRGEVVDVVLDDRASLGRPRVDVLVTTSGTYRDHFGDKIAMLSKAVRLAAAADEADNAVRASSLTVMARLADAGVPSGEARARADRRIYSTAPGAYSPSTQFGIKAGWDEARLTQLYTDRLGHAYGETDAGAADAEGFIAQMDGVQAAVFSRSSNAYGLLDTSMPAAYLGGLGMAVRSHTGVTVSHYVADLKDTRAGAARMEPLARTFGRELQSRYFNPAWLRAMQESGYNGARYMADLPAHLLLWDVSTPELVTDADWAQVKAVYVDDALGMGLDDYFEQHNPHARQHLIESLIEAVDRGVWQAAAGERRQLEAALAESRARHGADCVLPGCAAQVLAGTAPVATAAVTPAAVTTADGTAPSLTSAPAEPSAARPRAADSATPTEPAPPAATQGALTPVTGYALEPRPAAPAPVLPTVWPWLLAAACLLGAGAAWRPRW